MASQETPPTPLPAPSRLIAAGVLSAWLLVATGAVLAGHHAAEHGHGHDPGQDHDHGQDHTGADCHACLVLTGARGETVTVSPATGTDVPAPVDWIKPGAARVAPMAAYLPIAVRGPPVG